MTTEPYMSAIVELAAFLGLSDDQAVNPDSAVSQLEGLAAHLQRLDASEKVRFRSYVQQLARHEQSIGAAQVRIRFLDELSDNLGLNGREDRY